MGDFERETLVLQLKDLEREVGQWLRNCAVFKRRIEALERQLAEARAEIECLKRHGPA